MHIYHMRQGKEKKKHENRETKYGRCTEYHMVKEPFFLFSLISSKKEQKHRHVKGYNSNFRNFSFHLPEQPYCCKETFELPTII